VITDLIMPLMDGIELCSKMKNDELTSHIPIVMLTAKSSMAEKLEGLESGADDYLAKPFHMKELLTRIANLIDQRQKLRERFSHEIILEPREIAITSLDEVFLKRAIQIVEEKMGDENFDLNKFQDAMHMSHSTLFRKLFALTNQSPSGFIRNIRLKRAAQLLKEHFGNVARVSYEVGFNNPSYFSKCFKSFFGVSPVDYAKNNQFMKSSD
jgi:DNA-binding response OmpR family regulator